MGSKKIGRPKATNPLDYEVKARLNKDTFDQLNAYCKAKELERATVIRTCICQFLESEK